MSKSDDAYYAGLNRKEAEQKARAEINDIERPYKIILMQKVRSGEITLDESQRLARVNSRKVKKEYYNGE